MFKILPSCVSHKDAASTLRGWIAILKSIPSVFWVIRRSSETSKCSHYRNNNPWLQTSKKVIPGVVPKAVNVRDMHQLILTGLQGNCNSISKAPRRSKFARILEESIDDAELPPQVVQHPAINCGYKLLERNQPGLRTLVTRKSVAMIVLAMWFVIAPVTIPCSSWLLTL